MALIGSATIPSASVTNALGYTPVNKAGDTMSGALSMASLITQGGVRKIRHFQYATPGNIANGATVDLFSNAGQYFDVHFILWCQGIHSFRSWVILQGSVGGYGYNATVSGTQQGGQSYNVSYISDGYGKLRFTNSSGYAGSFSFGALILGDSLVTVHNGTLYE